MSHRRYSASLVPAGAAALFLSAAPAQSQIWTDMGNLAVRDPAYNTRGLAWGDVDGDSDLDLVMINFDGPGRLLLGDGLGGFVLVASIDLGRHMNDANHPVLADYDNDGDLDLFVANSALSFLFRNDGRTGNGGVRFTDISTGTPLAMVSMLARGAAWCDYDRDGELDLYVSTNGQNHPEEEDKLFRNFGGGQLTDITPPVFDVSSIGRACVWGDYDNDGDQDLFVANGFGCPCEPTDPYPEFTERIRDRMFRNNGPAGFEEVTADPLGDVDSARGAAWGDYDNDGDLDLYIANLRVNGLGGYNKLLRNDGPPQGSPGEPPRFTDVTTTLLADRGSHRSCAFVDVDNDGDLDIHVVGLNLSTSCELFVNDGHGGFSRGSAGPLTEAGFAGAAAWADFDRDGDMDVVMTWGGATGNRLLRNDLTNGNHWLEVELVGTQSNRSAIGSRITVAGALAPGGALVRQIREVQSGSGYLSQHMLIQHFGLGASATAVSVEVRWPDGSVQRVDNVAPDQGIRIVESHCAADVDGNGAVDSQDFLDFIESFFAGTADVNSDGVNDSQDYLDFIELFLSACGL